MLVYKIGFLDYQMITSDQIFSVPVCIDLWADWIPELSKNLFLPEPFRARKCQLDKLSFVFTFFCSLGALNRFDLFLVRISLTNRITIGIEFRIKLTIFSFPWILTGCNTAVGNPVISNY